MSTYDHDVAIYAPFAAVLYGRRGSDAPGGAEVQTTIMARELVERGLRVAHIVYPFTEWRSLEGPLPTIVWRAEWNGSGALGNARETVAIWRGLARANARAYIVRGRGGHLAPAAAFCRLRDRRLVFSAANDRDFDRDRSGVASRAYSASVTHAARVVVQTRQQAALARAAFPNVGAQLIPSFAEPGEPARNSARYFLWADRLVAYKRPLEYLALAAAVPEARFLMVTSLTSETDPDLLAQTEAEAARLANVELCSARPRGELLELMNDAIAVVSTSLVEGMPNTFLEAWSRRLPVLSLSFDPDGHIAGGPMGIVAADSRQRFAEGARALLGDVELRRRYGERGHEFVQRTHSPAKVGDRWESMVRELLADPKPGRPRR